MPPIARSNVDQLAARIAAVDFVVLADGSAAQLAGALGVSGAVIVPPGGAWYWMAAGDVSPWYPNLKLARITPQTRAGEIADKLQHALKAAFALQSQVA
jgi:hypothetical protein